MIVTAGAFQISCGFLKIALFSFVIDPQPTNMDLVASMIAQGPQSARITYLEHFYNTNFHCGSCVVQPAAESILQFSFTSLFMDKKVDG